MTVSVWTDSIWVWTETIWVGTETFWVWTETIWVGTDSSRVGTEDKRVDPGNTLVGLDIGANMGGRRRAELPIHQRRDQRWQRIPLRAGSERAL